MVDDFVKTDSLIQALTPDIMMGNGVEQIEVFMNHDFINSFHVPTIQSTLALTSLIHLL